MVLMVMSFIKGERSMKANKSFRVAIAALSLAGLSACSQSALRISPDFGNAVRQNAVAQIADPDARYLGTPAPGSDGVRVAGAQERYQTDTVIQPSTTTASQSVGSKGGQDNGANAGAGTSK